MKTDTFNDFVKSKKRLITARKGKVRNITATYPLPPIGSMNLSYNHDSTGQLKLYITVKKDKDEYTYPISSPFAVVARIRYVNDKNKYGLRIHLEDMDGECRRIDITRSELANSSQTSILTKLYEAGLRIENDGQKNIINILKAAFPKKEIVSLSSIGWNTIDDHLFFVTPYGEMIGLPFHIKVEVQGKEKPNTGKRGTLNAWKKAIDEICAIENAFHWRLGAMAGFAGVLQSLCEFETCGINLSGLSSTGKSTALKIAVSTWEEPKIGNGSMRSWRTTDNALEAVAASTNGTVLALDELGQADGKQVGKIIYSLSSGSGKSRMSESLILQPAFSWITFIISSGELSIESKIKKDGGSWQAGMSVRFPDIDVSHVNTSVDSELLNTVIEGISHNYGHAGAFFCSQLIELKLHKTPQALRERIMQTAKAIANSENGTLNRAAIPFAIIQVAGELAQSFDLLPKTLDIAETIQWGWNSYINSSDALSINPDEQIVLCLQEWAACHWNVNVKPTKDGYPNNREAEGWYDEECLYIPAKNLVKASGGNLKIEYIAKSLLRLGLIKRREDNKKATINYVAGIGKGRYYALDRDKLGFSIKEKE